MIPTLKTLFDRCELVGACRLWKQATSSSGVPYISVDGRTVSARRLAYTLAHGPIPPGKFISPKCKHKACSHHPTVEYGAAFDAMLFKAPVRPIEGVPGFSADELCGLLGSKQDTVWHHLHALKEKGLLYLSGHTKTGAGIYAWQPKDCSMADHVRDMGADRRARKIRIKRAAYLAEKTKLHLFSPVGFDE